MRELDYPRDYIFSFISEPGRRLTPACISEVEIEKIGAEVKPASDEEVGSYIAFRLTSVRPQQVGGFDTPLSSFRIRQARQWFAPGQEDMFRDETQFVEYKILFETDKASLLGYAKTMAAFANNKGGYIFFGVNDNGKNCEFEYEKFQRFDWDRFEGLIRSHFEPGFEWNWAVFEDDDGKKLGTIYTYLCENKPIMAGKGYNNGKTNIIRKSSIYYRYRGVSAEIESHDLRLLLQQRDEAAQSRVMKAIFEDRKSEFETEPVRRRVKRSKKSNKVEGTDDHPLLFQDLEEKHPPIPSFPKRRK